MVIRNGMWLVQGDKVGVAVLNAVPPEFHIVDEDGDTKLVVPLRADSVQATYEQIPAKRRPTKAEARIRGYLPAA